MTALEPSCHVVLYDELRHAAVGKLCAPLSHALSSAVQSVLLQRLLSSCNILCLQLSH